MQALDTQVNPRSAEFRANADAMRALVEDLRARKSRGQVREEILDFGGDTAGCQFRRDPRTILGPRLLADPQSRSQLGR